jgi:acetyl esterase/lipase
MGLVRVSRRHWIALLGVLGVVMSACANEALLIPLNWSDADSQITTVTDLAYGADARQKLDVYRPPTAHRALVILFWYGGSWQRGDKDYYQFVGKSLARRGFLAILPDYRLAPEHTFPAFVEDAAAAVRWVRDHAREYGGDPGRVYISGHSAGGHIALMLALDPEYLQAVGLAPLDIAGVASLAGPTGLENLRGDGLHGVFPQSIPDSAFSPITLAPLYGAGAPPILLMTGLDDDVVYARSVSNLADAIRVGGGTVTVKAYPSVGHIGLLLGFAGAFEAGSEAADDIARFAGL